MKGNTHMNVSVFFLVHKYLPNLWYIVSLKSPVELLRSVPNSFCFAVFMLRLQCVLVKTLSVSRENSRCLFIFVIETTKNGVRFDSCCISASILLICPRRIADTVCSTNVRTNRYRDGVKRLFWWYRLFRICHLRHGQAILFSYLRGKIRLGYGVHPNSSSDVSLTELPHRTLFAK